MGSRYPTARRPSYHTDLQSARYGRVSAQTFVRAAALARAANQSVPPVRYLPAMGRLLAGLSVPAAAFAAGAVVGHAVVDYLVRAMRDDGYPPVPGLLARSASAPSSSSYSVSSGPFSRMQIASITPGVGGWYDVRARHSSRHLWNVYSASHIDLFGSANALPVYTLSTDSVPYQWSVNSINQSPVWPGSAHGYVSEWAVPPLDFIFGSGSNSGVSSVSIMSSVAHWLDGSGQRRCAQVQETVGPVDFGYTRLVSFAASPVSSVSPHLLPPLVVSKPLWADVYPAFAPVRRTAQLATSRWSFPYEPLPLLYTLDPSARPVVSPLATPRPFPYSLVPYVRTNPWRAPEYQRRAAYSLSRPSLARMSPGEVPLAAPEIVISPAIFSSFRHQSPRPALAHALASPPARVKEGKVRLTGPSPTLIFVETVTESLDALNAVYSALPRQYRTQGATPQRKLLDLYEHFQHLDTVMAVRNLVVENVMDRAVASLHGAYRSSRRAGLMAGDPLSHLRRYSATNPL